MQHADIRVLVVDGSLQRDGSVGDALQRAGFQVRVVNDEGAGLGVLEVWQPVVVVVELRSPARIAREFCAAVSESPAGAYPPIVLVGVGPQLIKQTAVVPSGLIAAPFAADHLVATVLRVAQQATPAEGRPVLTH